MTTMKALRQIKYADPLELCNVPIPQAQPGSAIVRIQAANALPYSGRIYDGTRKYPYPTPLTVGSAAIGKIHQLGPDSTSLKEGQLVQIDIRFCSRDDPGDIFLSAIHEGFTPGSKKLMEYWRDGTFAEYMSVPLENCHPLNENLLLGTPSLGGLGYDIAHLLYIPKILVPYGGLTDINLRPGETIIIAPATGGFGGGAVHCALSLGARVIAMGRNPAALASLKSSLGSHFAAGRLLTVPITGDVNEEVEALKSAANGIPIDAFFDISPAQASKSTHFKAAIMSLRHSGRVSLMGGQMDDVAIPHSRIMNFNLTLKGKWMYERQDVTDMIRLIEIGTIELGDRVGVDEKSTKAFELEEWKEAFEWAESHVGIGVGAYFKIGE